jgi:DNA-binding PadR family transcriptional regulator
MVSSRQLAELKLIREATRPLSAYDVFKRLDTLVSRSDIRQDLEALERDGYIKNTVCVFLPRRAKIFKITTKGKSELGVKCQNAP